MLVVALTGGIGSGKSTATALFSDLGVPIIDADVIAREVVMKGSPALGDIQSHFGSEVITAEGELNRSVLREKIFSNVAERHWLQDLLHPPIRERIEQAIAEYKTQQIPYVIVSIPLFFESNHAYPIHRVCVVDVPEAIQISRACARDDMTKEKAQAILAAQVDRKTRLAGADDVLSNQGSEEALHESVLALHEQYVAMAKTSET